VYVCMKLDHILLGCLSNNAKQSDQLSDIINSYLTTHSLGQWTLMTKRQNPRKSIQVIVYRHRNAYTRHKFNCCLSFPQPSYSISVPCVRLHLYLCIRYVNLPQFNNIAHNWLSSPLLFCQMATASIPRR
jgi:hypothetical protein